MRIFSTHWHLKQILIHFSFIPFIHKEFEREHIENKME